MLDAAALLRLHARVSSLLRDRGVVRSANNPTGDYGEYLFAKAFGWKLAGNSNASYDAEDAGGIRYQIKSRRMTTGFHQSRQLGGIRDLDKRGFDVLAVALFDVNYDVEGAFLMPHSLIAPIARFSSHTNSSVVRLKEAHWRLDGVRVVTDELRAAASALAR